MYRFERVTSDDNGLQSCASVLSAAFPRAARFSIPYLRWQYAQNPIGEVVGFNAIAPDGTVSAHYVCLPIVAEVDGTPERGLLSLNTATHPLHQGKGLFTQLARMTYELGASLGYGFVVGVANQNSSDGFVRKLGFDLVTPLLAKLGIGPITSRDSFAARSFRRVWDHDVLRWRLQNPVARYRFNRGFIFSTTENPLIAAIIAPSHDSGGATEGSFPSRPVHLWIGRDPAVQHSRNPLYIDIPTRLRPSPLNLIFLDLGQV